MLGIDLLVVAVLILLRGGEVQDQLLLSTYSCLLRFGLDPGHFFGDIRLPTCKLLIFFFVLSWFSNFTVASSIILFPHLFNVYEARCHEVRVIVQPDHLSESLS